jgi:hypothetical protein
LDAQRARPLDDYDLNTNDAQLQRPAHQATQPAADTLNLYSCAIPQVSKSMFPSVKQSIVGSILLI